MRQKSVFYFSFVFCISVEQVCDLLLKAAARCHHNLARAREVALR